MYVLTCKVLSSGLQLLIVIKNVNKSGVQREGAYVSLRLDLLRFSHPLKDFHSSHTSHVRTRQYCAPFQHQTQIEPMTRTRHL